MAQVTNSDIMEKLGGMEARLIAVQNQAEKTNGRVTKAEEFINALKAVEIYKKDNPTQTQNIKADTVNVVQPKWFQNERLAYAVAAVLIAVATAITIVAGGIR